MARKTTTTKLEQSVHEAAQRFASDLLEIIRSATVEELTVLRTLDIGALLADAVPGPKRRAKPARAPAKAAPAKKARKKRSWPVCTADGCAKNIYMPSGAVKMCYQHYIEAGGKESPLVRYRKQKKKKTAKK